MLNDNSSPFNWYDWKCPYSRTEVWSKLNESFTHVQQQGVFLVKAMRSSNTALSARISCFSLRGTCVSWQERERASTAHALRPTSRSSQGLQDVQLRPRKRKREWTLPLSLSLSLSLSTSADGRALWRRLRRSRIPTYRGGERESTKKLCKGFYVGAKIWGGNSDNCYHPLDDPCHCLLGFLWTWVHSWRFCDLD